MFCGLATILCVYRFTPVAFTWYVLLGTATTFVVGFVVSRLDFARNHKLEVTETL
jgi:hypothetical protein